MKVVFILFLNVKLFFKGVFSFFMQVLYNDCRCTDVKNFITYDAPRILFLFKMGRAIRILTQKGVRKY